MDWEFLAHNFRILIRGTGNTLLLSAATLVLATLLALPLAAASNTQRRALRWPIAVYAWAARGIPELIILFFCFYGLGQLGLRLEPMPAAILAFTIFSTAYFLEIFRGGLRGVGRGQYDGAAALGLSYPRMMLRIILPQVLRIAAPAYLTMAISVLKLTSIASVVAVTEVTHTANKMIVATQRPFEILSMAFLIYVVMNSILIGLQMLIEKRLKLKT